MQNNTKVLTNYANSALQSVDLSEFHVNGLAWSRNVLCHKTTQKTNYDFARLRGLQAPKCQYVINTERAAYFLREQSSIKGFSVLLNIDSATAL